MTKSNYTKINNFARIIANKMTYISQESLNFSLSGKTLTFPVNQVLAIIDNIQDGCQQINNHTKIFNNLANILAMAKLKTPQHSLSEDLSKKPFFITIHSILLKFLKIQT